LIVMFSIYLGEFRRVFRFSFPYFELILPSFVFFQVEGRSTSLGVLVRWIDGSRFLLAFGIPSSRSRNRSPRDSLRSRFHPSFPRPDSSQPLGSEQLRRCWKWNCSSTEQTRREERTWSETTSTSTSSCQHSTSSR